MATRRNSGASRQQEKLWAMFWQRRRVAGSGTLPLTHPGLCCSLPVGCLRNQLWTKIFFYFVYEACNKQGIIFVIVIFRITLCNTICQTALCFLVRFTLIHSHCTALQRCSISWLGWTVLRELVYQSQRADKNIYFSIYSVFEIPKYYSLLFP